MMRSRAGTLPLGVDFGRSRIRVALSTVDRQGQPKLEAVAVRDVLSDPAAALREARRELRTRERRCVIGIAHPEALVRVVVLPKMSPFERKKAAAFQAARNIEYPVAEATVSLKHVDGDRWVLGVARRSALHVRVAAARSAGLVPLAVDDGAFALDRALRDADGTIDIADDVTRLTIFSRPIPYVRDAAIGGAFLTDGIARSLGIDASAAEERKRTIGFAGAGDMQRDALIAAVSNLLARACDAGHTGVERLLMVGNGSRVPGLAEAMERATGYAIRLAGLDGAVSDTLPPDVLRAAGADWSIAYGLSLWDLAS